MFSLMDSNIFNIAIQGVFDDCQDIVKEVSSDLDFKKSYKIGTVNSINWARLLAQVVYYFAGYFQATTDNKRLVSFSVPSGNFGNVCAGHVAKMMGLPVSKLVVATNENNVLDDFFKTGLYKVRNSSSTYETSSPSMDISKASNFERFIFDLLDRDAKKTAELFSKKLLTLGEFSLSDHPKFSGIRENYGFVSGHSHHLQRLLAIKDTFEKFGEMIDPHTADGLNVARQFLEDGIPMVVLETALPVKFSDVIQEAIGAVPPIPDKYKDLENCALRFETMPADTQLVKKFIAENCA